MADKNKNGSNETNFYGPVNGAVHTGSGDINISSLMAGGAISTKEDFLSALRAFKAEIDTAQRNGLPDDVATDAIGQIASVEHEANKDAPKPQKIVERLENVKKLLLAGSGAAAAVGTAATEAHKWLPMLEHLLQNARSIFPV
jgi:hypothetical protein